MEGRHARRGGLHCSERSRSTTRQHGGGRRRPARRRPERSDSTPRRVRQAFEDWIALPSIAAEDLSFPVGAEYMAKLAREAGFQHVEVSRPTASRVSSPRSTPAPRRRSGSTSCTTSSSSIRPSGRRRRSRRACRQAGPRQSDDGPRRGQSEGAAVGASSPRLHAIRGAGKEVAGEPGAGRRRRGGNRLAAHRSARAPARGRRRAPQDASACSCPRRRRTSTASSR